MTKIREIRTLIVTHDDGTALIDYVLPGDNVIERIKLHTQCDIPLDPVFERQEQAETDVSNIPNWATWTAGEAHAWFQTNVLDLLDAVPDVDSLTGQAYRTNAQEIDAQWQDIITAQSTVIHAMGQMLIAIRNKLGPELEGS